MSIDTQTLGAPVNGTAARVIGRGVKHDWQLKGGHPHWATPPATRPIDANTPDHRGRQFGRMTVIGLLRDLKGKWLCRCACGMYEPRSSKAICNPKNSIDSCLECRTLFQRRRHAAHKAYFDKHGCWPSESDGVQARRLVEEWGS